MRPRRANRSNAVLVRHVFYFILEKSVLIDINNPSLKFLQSYASVIAPHLRSHLVGTEK